MMSFVLSVVQMRAFAVDNNHDATVLRGLISKVFKKHESNPMVCFWAQKHGLGLCCFCCVGVLYHISPHHPLFLCSKGPRAILYD